MATGQSRREITRTVATAKRASAVVRDLIRALRVVESSFDYDYYGRVVWVGDENVDWVTGELRDLLRLARADYPEQEIEINVMVKVPPDGAAT